MKKLIIGILLSGYSVLSFSQHQNILIDDEEGNYPPCEPSIIINPANTSHMVAGAILDRYYYSTDGGLHWNKGQLSSPSGVWGDPVVAVDNNGSYYFFHLSNPPGTAFVDRIICQKANEIGDDWNEETYMGLNGSKMQDKEWGSVDLQNNNIYVLWTEFDLYGDPDPVYKSQIRFSRSLNGAASWSQPVYINEVAGGCMDDGNTVEGAVPAIGPQGEIYTVWAGPLGLVFDKSLDFGVSWLDHDIFVADIPGGWAYSIPGISRCNGLPVTKCDNSGGPYHGTIYVNWSDQRNGTEDTDIWLVKSTDQGATWSAPIRVNDDPVGKQQFMTWMDVDQVTGNLWFIWYDRRNYQDKNTDVYMAVSRDGGTTFTNFKISESPFLPYQSVFFGDYTNVSAHNSVVRPIWTRLQDGYLSIWTAIIDASQLGEEEEPVKITSLEQNVPNPFRESTFISFTLTEPAYISLSVINMQGMEVTRLYDHTFFQQGKHVAQFRPEQFQIAPGVYFYRLSSNDQILRRSMIFVR